MASLFSFPGISPPVLFKDIEARWKKQMYVQANKPNAKSTVAKRKMNVLIVKDRYTFCMRDPSPWRWGTRTMEPEEPAVLHAGDSDNRHIYNYRCDFICKFSLNSVVLPNFSQTISALGLHQAKTEGVYVMQHSGGEKKKRCNCFFWSFGDWFFLFEFKKNEAGDQLLLTIFIRLHQKCSKIKKKKHKSVFGCL